MVRVRDCATLFDDAVSDVEASLDRLDGAPVTERALQLNRVTLNTGKMLGLLEALVVLQPDAADSTRQVAERVINRLEAIRESIEVA